MSSIVEQASFNLHYVIRTSIFLSFFLATHSVIAADNKSEIDNCMQSKILQADNNVTVDEIRQQCQKTLANVGETTKKSNIERRQQFEKVAWDNPFVISVHKPNYVLLLAHNEKTNEEPFKNEFPDEEIALGDDEVKFQISVKFPLALNLFDGQGDVFFAYTNRSFWQLYNTASEPFRETNHEPEVFYVLKNDWEFLGFKSNFVNMGLVHQSNGRRGLLSRSWNRIYALFVFEKDNLVLGFKPWYRIPESEGNDDNPDIEDYMGNIEFTTVYTKGRHTFSGMLRNNLQSSGNRGALQIDWVFPLSRYFSGYLQYFSGYGESMIDYNYDQQSIGIGFALTGLL